MSLVELSSTAGGIRTSRGEYVSRVLRTSVWDWSEMSTASAEVTQPEQARQSVKEIPAGAGFEAWTLSSVVTS